MAKETVMENQIIGKPNYYEWFRDSVPLYNDEFDEEIQLQVLEHNEKFENTEKFGMFELSLKDENIKNSVKKAIAEVAFLFTGALEIDDEEDYKIFSKRLLLEASLDGESAKFVRENLLNDSSVEVRDGMANQLNERIENKRDLVRAKAKYNNRVDLFIDAYKKQLVKN